MAGDKKTDKKPSGEDPGDRVRRHLIEIFLLVLFLFFLARVIPYYSGENYIYASIMAFLKSHGILTLLHRVFLFLLMLSAILTISFITGIIYLLIRLREIEKTWHAMLNPKPAGAPEALAKNEKWERIKTHIDSSVSSDWRLAILECDILLDNLFDKLGYVGGTIGDKLKSVDPAHFKTLNNAWEAHKIRNAIAHQGQDFSMTDREARRVVGLYESVFKEFDFI